MNQASGICIGASTITVVIAENNADNISVKYVQSLPHEGKPKQTLQMLFNDADLLNLDSIAVTGRGFKEFLNLSKISEPLSVEYALNYINHDGTHYNAVVSAGGETFILYTLDESNRITNVYTGNKCASGTGEFFLQQIRRMDIDLDAAVDFAKNEEPYFVSGRCSVFCKSDCTHATNKGIPKGQVVAGLSQMMAQKVLELLKNTPKENILMIGGTTRIAAMIEYLKHNINNLHIPKEALYFEALGSTLWALKNPTKPINDLKRLFTKQTTQFEYNRPLQEYRDMVTFKNMSRGKAKNGDKCILGLDVGSTTTKVVLLRESDLKILASEYLRTNGDPVNASRKCYEAVLKQLKDRKVQIRGLGVTGSGRKIAGLHAFTEGVINEIIAHAEAALHFDKEVDTIFEIGGQDAKYTYITNGVASDYAMNEACSAGTGSFLEESAKETLGIKMEDIAGWAVKGKHPPNFNDQCAAFISSDIKNASHENISKEDIVAGLVYSICMNYVNRVKGNRPVGKKVFMQGGVCYNEAIPLAMAALSGKEIVVPPEPGLMGSYGVALEVKNRLDRGLMEEKHFDLNALIKRNVEYKKSFTCPGGKEKCDLGCEINRVVIENKIYPFGGSCNRYYNIRQKINIDTDWHNVVRKRLNLIFEKYAPDLSNLPENAPTVGLLRSLLMSEYYPLFSHFFKELGFKPVLADEVSPAGIDKCAAAFCYPCELSHGYFQNILDNKPDYVFLPHIQGTNVKNGILPSKTCPLVQGESYFLKSTFDAQIGNKTQILSPVIDFSETLEIQNSKIASLAHKLHINKKKVVHAYENAKKVQEALKQEMFKLGKKAVEDIEKDPDRIGVILFGRPYNAYVPEANKGIPHKFSSRGITIIPLDCIDVSPFPVKEHMYWSMGQTNLKGAEFIKDHPQLFGTFITNFSCGPDSFIIGYFREILKNKPSLTLELDNHTADAGLETRIEAFLDIVKRYRTLQTGKKIPALESKVFKLAESKFKDGKYSVITSDGQELSLNNPRVRLVFNSMSQYITQALATVYKGVGIKSIPLPAANEEDLKLGRGNTSCKECLPLQLTTGSLLKYLRDQRSENEVIVYFMPTADGPCRFGQYQDYTRDYIKKHKIKDVALFSMSCGDGYGGLDTKLMLLNWNAIIIADIFENIHNAMLVLAEDKDTALSDLQLIWNNVLKGIEDGNKTFTAALKQAVIELEIIPRKMSLNDVPQVLIVGEIYVRKEGLSRRWIPEHLANDGIVAHVAPLHEWLYYVDWLFTNKLLTNNGDFKTRLIHRIKQKVKVKWEKQIKLIMGNSGWYHPQIIDIDHVVSIGENFISRKLCGEAILTVGGPLAEIGYGFAGSIAIGPFGCMPNRLSESILNTSNNREHVLRFRNDERTELITREVPYLPFLAIESDGSPFPQIIEARLETFIMQVRGMDKVMRKIPSSASRV
jgi:predicted CoA-substrate-specific enzyme activase